MLVLTRRPGEQIVIGDQIRVTVVSLGPGRVKIGIEAPPNVRIDRQEIHDRIAQERASDVLSAVATSDHIGATQPIIVGSDTAAIPRAAEQHPAAPTEEEVPVNRIARHRLPRKPR
jgi:carbon storage regulator